MWHVGGGFMITTTTTTNTSIISNVQCPWYVSSSWEIHVKSGDSKVKVHQLPSKIDQALGVKFITKNTEKCFPFPRRHQSKYIWSINLWSDMTIFSRWETSLLMRWNWRNWISLFKRQNLGWIWWKRSFRSTVWPESRKKFGSCLIPVI